MPKSIAPTLWTIVITGRTPEQLRRTFAAHDFDGVIDARLEPGASREKLERLFKVRPKYVWLGGTLGVDAWGYTSGTKAAIDKVLVALIAKARYRQRIVLIVDDHAIYGGRTHREQVADWIDARDAIVCHVGAQGEPVYLVDPPSVHARVRRDIPAVFV